MIRGNARSESEGKSFGLAGSSSPPLAVTSNPSVGGAHRRAARADAARGHHARERGGSRLRRGRRQRTGNSRGGCARERITAAWETASAGDVPDRLGPQMSRALEASRRESPAATRTRRARPRSTSPDGISTCSSVTVRCPRSTWPASTSERPRCSSTCSRRPGRSQRRLLQPRLHPRPDPAGVDRSRPRTPQRRARGAQQRGGGRGLGGRPRTQPGGSEVVADAPAWAPELTRAASAKQERATPAVERRRAGEEAQRAGVCAALTA